MDAVEIIREALRKERQRRGIGVLAFEKELGFSEGGLRAILREQDPQIPSLEKAEQAAKALGWEVYVGPPRPIVPDPTPTKVEVLGPSQVRAFETGAVQGSILAEVEVLDGVAKLVLSPEDAKALADQLTYRAMQAEEQE